MNTRMSVFAAGVLLAVATCLSGCAAVFDRPEPLPEATGDPETAYSRLVAAAETEPTVTLYAPFPSANLDRFAEAFRQKYPGVELEATRRTTAETLSRIETEVALDHDGADVVLIADEAWVLGQQGQATWESLLASPQIAGMGDFDPSRYLLDDTVYRFGYSTNTFSWNTEAIPEGLGDYTDLLRPELAGRIGIVDASGSAVTSEFYRWLERTYGTEYLEKLAAQRPRIYTEPLQLTQALISGEIIAANMTNPPEIMAAKEAGVPVDVGFAPESNWAVPYYGAIPRTTGSPNAAALVADFSVSLEGQQALLHGYAPVIAGADSTVDLETIKPFEWAESSERAVFRRHWDDLFR